MAKRGFTLIEMLIVIAIIGILASIVLIGLGPIQARGRDARRIADLHQVQNALELYFNRCNYYPGGTIGANGCTGFTTVGDDWGAMTDALTGSGLGVNQIPTDPSKVGNYHYLTNNDGTVYLLYTVLEQPGAGNKGVQTPPPGINAPDCTKDYCLSL